MAEGHEALREMPWNTKARAVAAEKLKKWQNLTPGGSEKSFNNTLKFICISHRIFIRIILLGPYKCMQGEVV